MDTKGHKIYICPECGNKIKVSNNQYYVVCKICNSSFLK